MASFGEVNQSLDRLAETPARSCSPTENDELSLQEGAAMNVGERQRFLVSSLGKAYSPSTEVLKDMVLKFFDSSKDSREKIEPALCEDPRVARARLRDLADSNFKDQQELARFEDNMRKFEMRVSEGRLPAHEVAATYRQIERLLEASDNPAIPTINTDVRMRLAQEIMEQAASPTSINQGNHDTCNVTTVEARTYTRNPSAAARLVADIATTGIYMTAGDPQVEVRVNPSHIAPDETSAVADNAARSRASQIFQVTAVNIHYTVGTSAIGQPGRIVYEQVTPEAGAIPPDDGERLWDCSTDPPKEISRDPEISDDGVVGISNQITGLNESDVLIAHRDDYSGEGKLITLFDSEAGFHKTIERLHREGKFPVIVRVGSGNEPFLTDSGGGAAGGSGGAHLVTITGYRTGPPAMVEVDNQWGQSADHLRDQALAVHELYLATRASENPSTIADVEKDVESARKRNAVDAFQEIELLRLKRAAAIAQLTEARSEENMSKAEIREANRKSADEFEAGLAKQIRAAAKRWSKDGELYTGERVKSLEKLDSILKAMLPERRFAMLGTIRDSQMLEPVEYDFRLAKAIADAHQRWAAEDARSAEHPEKDVAATKRAHDERAQANAKMEQLLKELPAQRRKAVTAAALHKTQLRIEIPWAELSDNAFTRNAFL